MRVAGDRRRDRPHDPSIVKRIKRAAPRIGRRAADLPATLTATAVEFGSTAWRRWTGDSPSRTNRIAATRFSPPGYATMSRRASEYQNWTPVRPKKLDLKSSKAP